MSPSTSARPTSSSPPACTVNEFQTPIKIFEYAAANNPIVAANQTPNQSISSNDRESAPAIPGQRPSNSSLNRLNYSSTIPNWPVSSPRPPTKRWGHWTCDYRAKEILTIIKTPDIQCLNNHTPFSLPRFRKGGIERNCANITRAIANELQIDIITGDVTAAQNVLKLPPERFIQLNTTNRFIPAAISIIPPLISYLKREQPPVLLTFQSPFSAVIARLIARVPTKIVIRESNSIVALRGNPLARLIKRLLKILSYKLADKAIALCQEMRVELHQKMRVPDHKIEVIYNPIISDELNRAIAGPTNHKLLNNNSKTPTLVAMGRLDEQKDYPTLLNAFAILTQTDPANLIILGDGHLREPITKLISKLDLTSKVDLVGFTSNPYSIISQATVFVQTSLYEGLSNSLIEAQACAVPIVATECPTSPREILLNGDAGILVLQRDPAAFAKAIQQYLRNPELRQQHVKRATAATTRFAAEPNIAQYKTLITKLAQQ